LASFIHSLFVKIKFRYSTYCPYRADIGANAATFAIFQVVSDAFLFRIINAGIRAEYPTGFAVSALLLVDHGAKVTPIACDHCLIFGLG
jgi:hypothetical protein